MILVMQFWGWLLLSIYFSWLASKVKNKHTRIFYSIISILIPSIIGGLRQVGVGVDTLGYGIHTPMEVEASISFLDFMAGTRWIEPGYHILCYVVTKTLGSVHWCFFFYQLITVGCFYIGAYKHRKVAALPLSMFFFYCYILNPTYNMIRQGMSGSIVYMGLDNLEKKKYKTFMIYIFAAFCFHASAVLAIPLILGFHIMVSMKTRFRQIIIYLSLGLLAAARPLAFAFLSATNILPARYIGAVSNEYTIGITGARSYAVLFVVEFLTLTVFAKGCRKLLGRNNFDFYRINILIIFICTWFVGLGGRLTHYSDCVNMLTFAALPNMVKRKSTKTYMIIALIIAFSLNWYHICMLKETNAVWPYKSILNL